MFFEYEITLSNYRNNRPSLVIPSSNLNKAVRGHNILVTCMMRNRCHSTEVQIAKQISLIVSIPSLKHCYNVKLI